MAITVREICRYPVKGMTAQVLDSVALTPGEGLPHDRRFALVHAASQFDPARPEWMPKQHFLNLMRDEKLAQLEVRFDEVSGVLTILRAGKRVAGGTITERMGRTLVNQFLGAFMPPGSRDNPRVVEAAGSSFSDRADDVVSIVNLASVGDIERVAREAVDPRRFRANLYIASEEAWQERDWIDREIAVGSARLRVVAPIERCAATTVNPATAERDLNVPLILERGFGHIETGVYAEVLGGATIRAGDEVAVQDRPSN